MLGGTSINLSDLIRKLGMEISVSDITSVSISNNELLSIVSIDGTNDYVIKSLKMFDTEEEATEFADTQNNTSLSGIYGIVTWVVQKTYIKKK